MCNLFTNRNKAVFVVVFFVHGLIWKGSQLLVVSSGSNNRLNLGNKVFSRGRSPIMGWKLGQKGPQADSCVPGIGSKHPVTSFHFDFRPRLMHRLFSLSPSSCIRPQVVWTRGPLTKLCSFWCRSDPLNLHFIGFARPRAALHHICLFSLQEHV